MYILGVYSDIYRPISFELGIMYSDIDHQVLQFNISLDDLDLHSRSQLYEKSKTSVSIFLEFSQLTSMKFSMLPQPAGLLNLMLNLVCTSNFPR